MTYKDSQNMVESITEIIKKEFEEPIQKASEEANKFTRLAEDSKRIVKLSDELQRHLHSHFVSRENWKGQNNTGNEMYNEEHIKIAKKVMEPLLQDLNVYEKLYEIIDEFDKTINYKLVFNRKDSRKVWEEKLWNLRGCVEKVSNEMKATIRRLSSYSKSTCRLDGNGNLIWDIELPK